ncbi:hypothetical protein GCM10027597_48490 [Saccharopolyspora tripterygii]
MTGSAGVADADADPLGGQALEEVFDGRAAQPPGGTGDDDHGPALPLAKLTNWVTFVLVATVGKMTDRVNLGSRRRGTVLG